MVGGKWGRWEEQKREFLFQVHGPDLGVGVGVGEQEMPARGPFGLRSLSWSFIAHGPATFLSSWLAEIL